VTPELDELERCIVGALQVDGRATWRAIASALQVPERRIAVRGQALLNSNRVRVSANQSGGERVVVRLWCAPGASEAVAEELASRGDASFVYATLGTSDVLAELRVGSRPGSTASLLADLGTIPGLARADTSPVARVFKQQNEWRPGLLSTEQEEIVAAERKVADGGSARTGEPLSDRDREMLRILAENGRASYEELARRCRISEATARRWVMTWVGDSFITTHVHVEPELLGLPVQLLSLLSVDPAHVEALGSSLSHDPHVRYVVGLFGRHQMLVESAHASQAAAYGFLSALSGVAPGMHAIETSVVIVTKHHRSRVSAVSA